jgi:excinuclease UvrABC nuclease subunit
LATAISQLESQMREAAKNFEFERAAALRDRIRSLKQRDLGAIFSAPPLVETASTVVPVEATSSSTSAAAVPSASKDFAAKPVKKRVAKK